jgi:hypothetical protein
VIVEGVQILQMLRPGVSVTVKAEPFKEGGSPPPAAVSQPAVPLRSKGGPTMLSKFFLARPVFAWVIAHRHDGGRFAGNSRLPIAQYPPIAPPAMPSMPSSRALGGRPSKIRSPR